MAVNKERIFNRLTELGKIGKKEDGIYCLALSKEENEAHALVRKYMEEAGLKVRVDAAGNLIGRKEGKDPQSSVVMTGSHIDTVYGGGIFDGRLGVIGGIEALQAMNEEGIETLHPIEVIPISRPNVKCSIFSSCMIQKYIFKCIIADFAVLRVC